jgi:hypothetical protein
MANKTALHQATGHHSKFLAAIRRSIASSFHSFGRIPHRRHKKVEIFDFTNLTLHSPLQRHWAAMSQCFFVGMAV